MTLCSSLSTLLGSVRLWERISEKSEDEWGGSNSSPEVRFRIPGAHTTACLHTDIPAECMSASEGPGMCVCVWVGVCVSVFFMHTKCVQMNILHSIYISSNIHTQTYQSKQRSELFLCEKKNTHRCRGVGSPNQTKHSLLRARHSQSAQRVGGSPKEQQQKNRAPSSLIWAKLVPLKLGGIQRGETAAAFNCWWCLPGCSLQHFISM